MKIKFFTLFSAIFIALIALTSCNQEGKSVYLSSDIAEDATYEVFSVLHSAKDENISMIEFQNGTYHFYPEKAMERFCYISNHNDALTRIAFLISDMDNLTINGNGSTFVFHGCLVPFWVENSSNITIKDVTVEFEEAFHSEGVVVANNAANKTFDLKISPEYPYEIRNGELIFLKSYYEHDMGQAILFNPENMSTYYQTELITPVPVGEPIKSTNRYNAKFEYKYGEDKYDRYIGKRGRQAASRVEQIKPGLVRYTSNKTMLPPVGSIFVCKGGQNANRLVPGIKGDNVTNFKAEEVYINHAGGMGFLFENCENVDLYKCRIEPSKGRHVSTTADATHFVGCRGKVSLRDCIFHNQLDDAMNVHGTYQPIQDILSNYSVGVRMGHFQQLGFKLAKVGDTIGVVRLSDSFNAYEKLTVKSVDFINGRYQRINFNEELPQNIKVGDLLENLSAYPEVLVENCDISRNRARGLLISTPRKTVVRNNFFSTEMAALLLPVESSSWYESGNAENVLIENNTFQDCVTGGKHQMVIMFETDDESENIAFRNIEILNNTFNQFDNCVLQITNVDNLLFKGNKITNSGTYPQLFPEDAAITVQYSKNIKFEDNIYEGIAPEIVRSLNGQEEIKFQ